MRKSDFSCWSRLRIQKSATECFGGQALVLPSHLKERSEMLRRAGVSRLLLLAIFLFTAYNLQLTAFAATTDREYVEKLFLEEKYEKAAVEAGKLIDGNASRRDELYYLKGLSEMKTGKFSEARKDFEYIISRYPGSKRTLDAHIGVGDAYFLEGNKTGAMRSYNAVLEEFPDNKNIAVVRQRVDNCRSDAAIAASASYVKENTGAYPVQSSDARRPLRAETVNFTPKTISPVSAKFGSYFSVQVGSFKSRTNAQKLSGKLSKKNYESRVELPTGSGDKLYRVKVGRLASSREADTLALKLKREGYPIRICRED